ncbi:MAG: nucleotidyltransferase family protein [Pseudomonadota bacterium]
MPSELSDIAIVLLAAGQSSRMQGKDKLAELVDGVPCLRVMALRALEVSQHVVVTLPDLSHTRAGVLQDLALNRVAVPNACEGMSASLKTGISVLRQRAAMILPADMPGITSAGLAQITKAHKDGRITRATDTAGTPGHPVIFDCSYFPDLDALEGDEGARIVLKQHADQVDMVTAQGFDPLTDLDTQNDWAAWRKHQAAQK